MFEVVKNTIKALFMLILLLSVVGIFAYIYFLYKSKQFSLNFGDARKELKQLGEHVEDSAKKIEIKTTKAFDNLNQRQEELLSYLKKKQDWVKMNDLSEAFKNVSSRTLRRDLQKLFEESFVTRKGNTKNRSYKHF